MCESDKLGAEHEECRPFSPEKLLGVGVAGAISSLILYYFYHQLSPGTRTAVKENIAAVVKAQLKKIGES
jgi:hypothetical protein